MDGKRARGRGRGKEVVEEMEMEEEGGRRKEEGDGNVRGEEQRVDCRVGCETRLDW